MTASLFRDLSARLARDPSLTKRGGPRADLGLLLFNARDALEQLWLAAEATVVSARREGRDVPAALVSSVDMLRPIFGERTSPP